MSKYFHWRIINNTPSLLSYVIIFIGICVVLYKLSIESATALEAASFEGHVTRFLGPLQFKLDCCDAPLEIGMVEINNPSDDKLAAIEGIVRAHRWICTAFGYGKVVDNRNMQMVWCNAEDGTLLSALLIERGLVTERCAYSGNQFGTCDPRQLDVDSDNFITH